MDTASKTYFDWKFVLPIGSFYELQNRPYKVEYEVTEGSGTADEYISGEMR